MIKIQPSLQQNTSSSASKAAFKGDSYQDEMDIRDFRRQKYEMERLAYDKDTPGVFSKIFKGAVVLTSAVLGGLTMKVGFEKTFEMLSKFAKRKSIRIIKVRAFHYKQVAKKAFKKMAEPLKKDAAALYAKFLKLKWVQSIDNALQLSKIAGKAKTKYVQIKNYLKEKLSSREKIKKYIIDVFAGASAVATGAAGAAKTDDYREQRSRRFYEDYQE